MNITLGQYQCLNSVWLNDDIVYNFQPYLKCITPTSTSGYQNITLEVAYQLAPVQSTYKVQCKAGSFGTNHYLIIR